MPTTIVHGTATRSPAVTEPDRGSALSGPLRRPRRRGGRIAAAGLLLAAALVLAAPGGVAAQEEAQEERIERLEATVAELRARIQERDTTDIEELRQRLEAVVRELERLRLGRDVVTADTLGLFGLAPAASKVYRSEPGVSIGGYGEVLYENFASEREDGSASGATDELDALRAIVYVGYKFNDRILFNSEIEFEHGSTGQAGSASVEFAYLDYFISESMGFRGGLLLPPMGFLNEIHEPPTFLGTERPQTEQAIIPSTWRENGIGMFASTSGLDFRFYVVNGLDAVGGGSSNASGFSASGVRGGRQKGSQAVAEDFGGVARVDYTGTLGLLIGTSAYLGQSGQNNPSPLQAGETIGATTFIWEGHLQYKAHGLDLRGLFALADVGDVEELNAAKGLDGNASIGERMIGGYAQVGYDVLRGADTQHQLLPYVRWEKLNTQNEVPEGFTANPANDRSIVSLGAAWKPIPQAILKTDYQIHSNQADTGVDQFNVALGWLF